MVLFKFVTFVKQLPWVLWNYVMGGKFIAKIHIGEIARIEAAGLRSTTCMVVWHVIPVAIVVMSLCNYIPVLQICNATEVFRLVVHTCAMKGQWKQFEFYEE